MQRRKFIALPNDDTFHLTPKLWMAVGLIAYNFHLLTLEPVEVLSASHGAHHIPPTRAEAAACGLAAMLSTEGLTLQARSALTEIARILLTPFGLTVSHHGGSPIPGTGRTTRYLLIEDIGGADEVGAPVLTMPEPRKAIV